MATTSDKYYGSAESNSVQKRTQECLDELRNKKDQPANVLILFGRRGDGKSAYFEDTTDTFGHSKQRTVQFQIERVEINSEKYYIMDTPGFDTDNEQEVFLELIRGIEAVRLYATIIGLIFVTRIGNSSMEAVDAKLIDLFSNLCGDRYMSQVTMVTTFWDASQEEESIKFPERLQSRMEGWKTILGQGLKHYQHGRQYQDGIGTGKSLCWGEDHDDIKRSAKMMISRHYGSIHPQDPRIVKELAAGVSLEKTAAGQLVGLTSAHGSHSASLSPSSKQTEPTEEPRSSTSQSNSSASTPSEASRPSTSTDRMPYPEAYDKTQNQNLPQNTQQPSQQPEPAWVGLVVRVGTWGFNNVVSPLVEKVLLPELERRLGGRPVGRAGAGGGVGGGGQRGFPSWLDPFSSVDQFRARGMPSDEPYRIEFARKRGIMHEPRSAEFGEAVRKAVMREFPL
ncbi:hypothetical protein BKA65DRAFT_475607 [Rhexocercosporidium sp. MPI-PUGE-AT-0058]|nr:hypothetical protein BKA65DRAFT_475607 [Rhexocercosporidium sp. MPI-PUGE-AT-0058]